MDTSRIDIISVEDNPDGTANVEIELDKAGQKMLMEAGFVALLREHINTERVEELEKKNEDLSDYVKILEDLLYWIDSAPDFETVGARASEAVNIAGLTPDEPMTNE